MKNQESTIHVPSALASASVQSSIPPVALLHSRQPRSWTNHLSPAAESATHRPRSRASLTKRSELEKTPFNEAILRCAFEKKEDDLLNFEVTPCVGFCRRSLEKCRTILSFGPPRAGMAQLVGPLGRWCLSSAPLSERDFQSRPLSQSLM